MKHFFFILFSGMIVGCSSSDNTSSADKEKAIKDSANYTTIEWLDSTTQQIGKVNQGQVVEISWHFKNSGAKPLVIANVRPGCGCTGAEGPNEPIAPGKESVIKAKFNTENYPGTQHKQVFVRANNSNRNNGAEDALQFEVEVVPKAKQ